MNEVADMLMFLNQGCGRQVSLQDSYQNSYQDSHHQARCTLSLLMCLLPALRMLSLLICLLPALLMAGCGQDERPAGTHNILFISVDTLRQDHLGCYGYERDTSPHIDGVAARGTVFKNMVASSPWTLPSHVSMLTGLYPAFHTLQDDGAKLPGGIPTLAERLSAGSYFTMAVVSHVYVSSQFGLERGFDCFDDSLIEEGAVNPVAGQVVDRALQLFDEAPEGRFFAFLHFFDPHWDYDPPPPFDTRFTDPEYKGAIDGTMNSMEAYLDPGQKMADPDRQQAIDLYDGEIAYLDHELGRLFAALETRGRMANTVIVLTADHGEEFKEHGLLGHGRTLYEEQLSVPLIVAGHPAFPAGPRAPGLVSTVDLAPTFLDLAGAEPLVDCQGISLVDRDLPRDRIVFAESIRFGNEMRAARMGPHKMIKFFQGGAKPYFNLADDPGERKPRRRDRTEGTLDSALADYGMVADEGWHMKFISTTAGAMKCTGTLRTTGSFTRLRQYYSASVKLPSMVRFDRLEVSPDGKTLTFEVLISELLAQITFSTEPPDAPVEFEVRASRQGGAAGLYLGSGVPIKKGQSITLERDDMRLKGLPNQYMKAPPGCYIRAVTPRAGAGESTNLSPEAIERLRALGY